MSATVPETRGPRQAFFDVWSRFYDLAPVQDAIYRPVHEAVLRELRRPPRPERVLDLGCGTGLLTSRLPDEGARLVCGCDFSFGMLAQARERSSRVAWVQGDAMSLPFSDGAVEAAVSTEAFHWFPDHDAALAELHRVLAPGGRLLVALVNPRIRPTSRVAHLASRAVGEPAQWPTRAELRERLEDAGFGVDRQERVVRIAGLLVPTVLTVARR